MKLTTPSHKCQDVTEIGHNGNGNVSLRLSQEGEIDYAMNIIRQAYDKQAF